jgi:hypothetical protein
MTASRLWLGLGVLGATSAYALGAAAAPPGDWAVAVERLFGLSRTSVDFDDGNETTTTSLSLFSKVAREIGYSAPRLGLDYLASSGVSVGLAFGYQAISIEGAANGDAFLFAPRLGYFARPSSGFGIWPRAGITHIIYDYPGGDTETATAITLEVPLEFLLAPRVALVLTPLAEIGIAGSASGVDRTATELGLQFGLGAFF